MTLSIEEVEHIARLARLSLSPAEKELFRAQLSSILEHVARLQALDTREIPPTFSVSSLSSVLRADEPVPGLAAQELLSRAPQTEAGQFRIPAVFDEAD
jgi:aspartyl-tRNA(Asn)/glutamyl-tRNA(Gln) amidotransferase subunit C